MTNQRPFFEVARVDFNQPVKLFVFAQNAKGSSEPFIIEETGNAKKHAVEGTLNLVISKSIFLKVPRPPKINLLNYCPKETFEYFQTFICKIN